MRFGSTYGSSQPVEDALVLGDDDREERFAERVGLALEHAEVVAAAVRVLRREDDEAALGQPRGEGLVGAVAAALSDRR